ncbi:hypothetical protein PBI_ROPE_84 [Mycobacterium phage Rope]|uniref:Uncharacterized protein n=1 Tax=Mycobacterium phage Rope TaxID=2767563 RepID=A0A7G9V0D8_9CAUD|nr:hypothetical protein PBI_ROPE_84 [Mycobacterium phage Rope]
MNEIVKVAAATLSVVVITVVGIMAIVFADNVGQQPDYLRCEMSNSSE